MTSLRAENRDKSPDRDALRILLGGVLGLMIVMGIGRFAFTPILPLMQRDLGMSNTVAGWLAGLNYLGYLAGALFCSFSPRLLRFQSVAVISLLVSLATTLAMGCTLSVAWWGVLRFGGGVASAVLFIIISAEVAAALMRRGYGHWAGAMYGGVGAGIALSGLTVPWLDRLWQWDGAWIGMAVIATLLAITGRALASGVTSPPASLSPTQQTTDLRTLWPLVVAYFFEGLGYIVTATFLVAIVAATPGLSSYAPYSWVVVGLAAVPSTILWPLWSRRIGSKRALLAAYAIQAVGILVSMHADTIIGVLFAAITFGGTFMGIVAMTLAEGNLRLPHNGNRAAAILTTSFGVGQILGPIAAGAMADMQHGFALPLLLAAVCVLIGGLFIALDRHFSPHPP